MENSRAGFQEEGVDRRGWHVDDQLGLHGRPRGVQLRGYRRDRRPAERLRLPQRPMQVLEKNISSPSASLESCEGREWNRKISPRTLIFIFTKINFQTKLLFIVSLLIVILLQFSINFYILHIQLINTINSKTTIYNLFKINY